MAIGADLGNAYPDEQKSGMAEEQTQSRATELEYLKWFRVNADFGPAHSDVTDSMNQEFMRKTGKLLPLGWNYDSEGNEI